MQSKMRSRSRVSWRPRVFKPHFPRVLDSSMIRSFRSCPQKFYLEYIHHWRPKTESVHLVAGGAYASGLEAARKAYYQEGLSEEDSIAKGLAQLIKSYGSYECPADSAKSLERTAGALEFYFSRYPLSTEQAVPISLPSGGRGIEFSFAEPVDATNPETGEPLIYCGRMDMTCNYAGGVFGEDDKTTSYLGATWSKQWDQRSQFTGYCWGAARGGLPLQGFIIRGVSILKTKYDTQQAITYRPTWMIERWYAQLLRDIARMKRCWESGIWDYSLDGACDEYGGCVFRQPCMSKDPLPWLEGSFERRAWNPLTRTEDKPD
jgi:hypothetical protein